MCEWEKFWMAFVKDPKPADAASKPADFRCPFLRTSLCFSLARITLRFKKRLSLIIRSPLQKNLLYIKE